MELPSGPLDIDQQVMLDRNLSLIENANTDQQGMLAPGLTKTALYAEWDSQTQELFPACDLKVILIADQESLTRADEGFRDFSIPPEQFELFKAESAACRAFTNHQTLYCPDITQELLYILGPTGGLLKSTLAEQGILLGTLKNHPRLKSFVFSTIYYAQEDLKLGSVFLGSWQKDFLIPEADLPALKLHSEYLAASLRSRYDYRLGILEDLK